MPVKATPAVATPSASLLATPMIVSANQDILATLNATPGSTPVHPPHVVEKEAAMTGRIQSKITIQSETKLCAKLCAK